VEADWKSILWRQCGAAIDTLGDAMRACPDELWHDRARQPEFWYVAFHTLFFLDFYSSNSSDGFAPPAPFTRDELDPAGILPERPYTRAELLTYLEHGRGKCRAAIGNLTAEDARRRCRFERPEVSAAELFLYNMRHVQHHAAQLNLILRQTGNPAPRWVARSRE
jgi:hypothetical protein